ncbi:MAG TPA: hypothetical protein VFB58_13535 [Chloroflexota bacterium]|nr:hypothetical protein [Chloroflexota bacterium]
MRTAVLTDLQGNTVGTITEADDGTLSGEGVAERLLQQAPLKTFDDWKSHLHHSTYLRFVQEES